MPGRTTITLDEALDLTRTGDIWLFRGRTMADRAIQMTTNSPVNHVGMAVVLEDLPPLMWHAELGRSLPDLWSGTHQRGVQLHDLRASVLVWARKYGQQAWLRQLDQPVTREMEDAVLRTIALLDGTPFPSSARMAARWLRGRVPSVAVRETSVAVRETLSGWWRTAARRGPARTAAGRGSAPTAARRWPAHVDEGRPALIGSLEGSPAGSVRTREPRLDLETAYCAEVIAVTYEAMGLLPGGRRTSWYDAGRFWSGDDLPLVSGARLGGELAVEVPVDDRPRS
jgi:hypothetical protein